MFPKYESKGISEISVTAGVRQVVMATFLAALAIHDDELHCR